MHRSVPFAMCSLLVGLAALTDSAISADFVTPPEAERQAVATLGKQASRIQIDADYRVITVWLGSEATNDDLKLLASCDRLAQLQVSSPKITDEGAEHLKSLKSLTSLSIVGTNITSQGVASLRAALPNCRITDRISSSRQNPPSFAQSTNGRNPRGELSSSRTFARQEDGGTGSPSFRFTAGSRLLTLARNNAVQDELKLSSEQRQQVESLADAAAINRIIDQKISESLTQEQQTRLKQIELQQAGIAALVRDEVVGQLKITEAQRIELSKVIDETSSSLRSLAFDQRSRGDEATDVRRERMQELSRQREEKMLSVLSDEQKQAWKALLGSPALSLTAPAPANALGLRSVADLSRSVFSRYDTDKDGALSDAEFPASNRTRQTMDRAGIVLTFPVKQVDFEKAYTKYVESLRNR